MNILYIHQYFKIPSEPGGTRSYWIAKSLAAKGYNVTMLTSGSNLNKKKVVRKNIDGINVIYVNVSYDQNMSIVRRMYSFLSFMFKASFVSLKIKNIELVVATSTPLTVGFPALLLNKIKGIPYVFEVRDLWPEVPIQMGGLKNPIIRKAAVYFEKYIYKNAKHIITLSPGMREGVLKMGISKKITSMIPNMAKIDKFWPRKNNSSMIKELGLKLDSFKIIHFGALGRANGAMAIINSAKLIKNENIEFIFIGGGATEKQLREECNMHCLRNVHFLGRFPMEQTSEIVNFSDVSIVSFLDLPILYTNSPNKLFDSLSAGKPVIVNSAGWTKELVENYNCGCYVDPNNPHDLVDKILFLRKNSKILNEMGVNARKLAEVKYDKSILCEKFVDLVKNLK